MPFFSDAGAQMRFLGAHLGAHGVTGAARGIDDDVGWRRYCARSGEKPRFHQQIRNVFLIGLGGRIFLRDHGVELRFGVLAAGTEAVVPDVETARADGRGGIRISFAGLRDQRRSQHLLQHGFARGLRESRDLRRSGGRSAWARWESTDRPFFEAAKVFCSMA